MQREDCDNGDSRFGLGVGNGVCDDDGRRRD
jgi:hypothetical protein